jgi:hypothetical protein
MPFCYFPDSDDDDEDDVDVLSAVQRPPPKVSQFHYTPASFRRRPVRFSDRPPAPPGAAARRPSQLDRLLLRAPRRPSWELGLRRAERRARRMGDVSLAQSYAGLRVARTQDEQAWQRRGQQTLALAVAALRGIGARSAYCRYDGGNDEGFAWLDHVVHGSGDRLPAEGAAARLAGTGAEPWPEDSDAPPHEPCAEGARNPASLWRDGLLTSFACECARRLLGSNYGLGPTLLYGAFTVDLEACTIADDPGATPVVRTIQIEA